jgi:hypothetical protein
MRVLLSCFDPWGTGKQRRESVSTVPVLYCTIIISVYTSIQVQYTEGPVIEKFSCLYRTFKCVYQRQYLYYGTGTASRHVQNQRTRRHTRWNTVPLRYCMYSTSTTYQVTRYQAPCGKSPKYFFSSICSTGSCTVISNFLAIYRMVQVQYREVRLSVCVNAFLKRGYLGSAFSDQQFTVS